LSVPYSSSSWFSSPFFETRWNEITEDRTKNPILFSVDIDGDGIKEIPMVVKDNGNIYLKVFKITPLTIISAEKIILKAKSMGLNPLKAEELLNQAKREFSKGNYQKTMELVRSIIKTFEDYITTLSNAESIIEKYKNKGLPMDNAEKVLNQSKLEFSRGNYDKAIELAKQSYELAIDIDQDGIPNDEDFAPTIPNNYVYVASVIVVGIVVTSGYHIKKKIEEKRRYEMEKRKLIEEMDEIINELSRRRL
jgi:tetratricopeptide (TPR) repeat protein